MKNCFDISIVIPVYNTEKYISKCVDSVFPIELGKAEIILVDDGSTDQSGILCDQLAAKHPGVRVIHKENGGASSARNTGIKSALADYIMFVDGDDYLVPGAVDKILSTLDYKTEILTYDFYEDYDDGNPALMKHLRTDQFLDNTGSISKQVFKTISPLPMPWLYTVSKKYLIDNQIFLRDGLLDEDEEWTARLFAGAKKIQYLHEPICNYRRNVQGSLTFNRKLKNTLSDIEIIRLLENEWKNDKYSENGKCVLRNKARQMVEKVLDDLEYCSTKDSQMIRRELAPYRFLLKDGTSMDKLHYYFDGIIGRKRVKKIAKKISEKRQGKG